MVPVSHEPGCEQPIARVVAARPAIERNHSQESGVAPERLEKLAGTEPDAGAGPARLRSAALGRANRRRRHGGRHVVPVVPLHPPPAATPDRCRPVAGISRYYLGERVPVGRTVSTVPGRPADARGPERRAAGQSLAIVVLAAACYAALAWIAIPTRTPHDGDAGGGLLAVVSWSSRRVTCSTSSRWAPIRRAVGVIGMSVCLLGLLRVLGVGSELARILLAGGTLVTVFFHTPSATVLLPVFAYLRGISLLAVQDARPHGEGRSARPCARADRVVRVPALNGSSVFGYANVAAAYDLKGPDRALPEHLERPERTDSSMPARWLRSSRCSSADATGRSARRAG